MKNEEVKKVNEILVKSLKDFFPEHKFRIEATERYNQKTNKRDTFIDVYASIPVTPQTKEILLLMFTHQFL